MVLTMEYTPQLPAQLLWLWGVAAFFLLSIPRSKTVLHFPSVPCQPNAIKLSRCVQFQVFHVNRTLSSCEDVWRTRMHPSVAIEMWIGIPGLRKEKPKGVVASWWGEHPKASRYRQSLVSHHHWWGVHHFGCHSHQKKNTNLYQGRSTIWIRSPRKESTGCNCLKMVWVNELPASKEITTCRLLTNLKRAMHLFSSK